MVSRSNPAETPIMVGKETPASGRAAVVGVVSLVVGDADTDAVGEIRGVTVGETLPVTVGVSVLEVVGVGVDVGLGVGVGLGIWAWACSWGTVGETFCFLN